MDFSPPKFRRWIKTSILKAEEKIIRGSLRTRLHVSENAREGIIFLKDTISLFSCSPSMKKALEDFLMGCSKAAACLRNSISEEHFDLLLNFIYDKIESYKEQEVINKEKNTLERLVINISHQCNLRCRYCYAQGGGYGLPLTLMTRETALKVIEKFYSLFDQIDNLQFFGGEPFLNIDLMDFICNTVDQKYHDGLIKKLPNFCVVTNGTLFSDRIIGLLKKHLITPTVSLDGPEDIQDYLRGKGTYQKVLQFLHLLEKRNIDYSFETTYTSFHLRSGLTLNSLLDFFFREFQKREIHIPLVALPPSHPLWVSPSVAEKLYREAIEYSIDNLRRSRGACLSFASRMMRVFSENKPIPHYCPAGYSTLSVDTAGYVYPCFMFIGLQEFNFGNVADIHFPDRKRFKRYFGKIQANDKMENSQCLECWVSPLCSGCLGADYIINEGGLEKTECGLKKAMADSFLAKSFDLLKNMPYNNSKITNGKKGWMGLSRTKKF